MDSTFKTRQSFRNGQEGIGSFSKLQNYMNMGRIPPPSIKSISVRDDSFVKEDPLRNSFYKKFSWDDRSSDV